MTETDWQELERLTELVDRSDEEFALYCDLIKRTREEYEHPEDFYGYCECQTCQSYGD